MVTAWGTTRTPRHIINMMVISIHVPAWGTTGRRKRLHKSNRYFNPRSRVGNDPVFRLLLFGILFQSTFPRGERPVHHTNHRVNHTISIHIPAWGTTMNSDSLFPCILNFNPRSRVGNDCSFNVNVLAIMISIHVPAWGTTLASLRMQGSTLISIHVPAWGTTKPNNFTKVLEGFQSTFPRGERLRGLLL